MRRKKYSRHIADWIGGTRSLSDRAYRVYDEVCLLIAEAGGRLPMATPRDEEEARKRLACDRRKWFAAMAELRSGDRPKLRLVDGWLVNKRTLIECDVLLVALEAWGWSYATLVDVIGVDPRDIDAARERRRRSTDHEDRPVDRGDNARPPPSRHAAAEARSTGSRPEVSPTSRGIPAERGADIGQFQEVTRFERFPLLSSISRREEVETPSPEPRARDPGGGGGLLGEGRPIGTPRGHGFRWGRPETAETRLLLALIGEGMSADDAVRLIKLASDLDDPGHLTAGRECEAASYRNGCGWYRPRRIVN